MNVEHWALSPEVLHLNHGSYGGCRASVIAEATRLRTELEAAPMRFYVLEWQDLIDRARESLAAFVGAPADRLVFVPNATHGVAIAIASCRIEPGDEIVTTNHTYRAVRNQLARLAAARGAHVTTVSIALPFDPDAWVAALEAAVTPRTRLVVLDHVTSPTALIFPLERIVPALVARGIQVVIDGAHAPGQIALDITALGATYYAGNNHKWLCAPKATGFLVARGAATPIVTSHGASSEYGPPNRLHAELDWSGTGDPTAHLCVPAAIAAVADWPATRARNHALALALRDRVIAALAGDERHHLAPATSLGCMAAIPVRIAGAPLDLTKRLLRDNVELPIVDWPGQPFVRISAHLYNDDRDADALIAKLKAHGISLAP
ncbi:MAG: aminotransferase class V-fold PLP-dependent enzyme [Deltaproteobacteria bacterium]